MDFPFIIDPKTNKKSVSLTLLIVTFVSTMIVGVLNVAGIVSSTGIFTEILYSCTALYFSRNFSLNGKSFSSEKAEKITKKVEEINEKQS